MEQHQTAVHVHELNIQFGSVAGRMVSKIVWWPELCGGFRVAATPVLGCSGTRIIVLRYLVGQQQHRERWGHKSSVLTGWYYCLSLVARLKNNEKEKEREFKTAHWVDKWRETGCCSRLPAPACCWRSRGTEPTQTAACWSKER